jgi:hypothetical protein
MRLRNSSHVMGTFWDEWSQWCNRLLPTKAVAALLLLWEKSGGEKMATKEFLSATKPLARSRALLAACGVAAVAKLEPAKAAFPGKNGAIAFTSARDGQPEVYRMRANGSHQRRLSDTAGVANGSPQWSADGQKIVFTSHPAFKDCPQT